MEIDEKALQAAIAWYWRAGAISENIPRGCIREYLANLPNPGADVEIVEADRLGYIRGYADGIKDVDNSHSSTERESVTRLPMWDHKEFEDHARRNWRFDLTKTGDCSYTNPAAWAAWNAWKAASHLVYTKIEEQGRRS